MGTDYLLDDIDFRIRGLCADLRAFLVIRKENRQHKEDGLGGGNITMALVLFSILDFLSKIHFFVSKNGVIKYNEDETPKINTEEAFIKLIGYLRDHNLNLGIEEVNKRDLKELWRDYRDHLVHLTTVGEGNQMSTYLIDQEVDLSIDQMLDLMKSKVAFEKSSKKWRLNTDNLLAKMPDIWRIIRVELESMKLDSCGRSELKRLVR